MGKSKKIIICQSVSIDSVLRAVMTERILDGMTFDAPADASRKRHRRTIAVGSPRRRVFGHQGFGSAISVAIEDDLRFLRHIGSVIDAQSDLVKSSVSKVAESRELLAKVNDLLRR